MYFLIKKFINFFIIIIFIQLLIIIKQTNSFCPSKCKCTTTNLNYRTSCINANLDNIPIQLNPDTKYINLTLNKIRNVEFSLPFYTKLEVFDLSQNRIDILGTKNFEYQRELRTLNLSYNSITKLSKDTFKGLINLLILDLSYNHINDIHITAMNNMTNLIQLDLSNNFIISFDNMIFKNMISLEILLLKNNQLLDIPYQNLLYLPALKSLDLSINLIEIILNNSFNQLNELIILNLNGNVITDINENAFDGLIGLKHLNIGDNNLTVVPTQQLSKLSNLTYLSLSGNRFTQIPAVALLNLFHLKELYLERLDELVRIDSRAFVDNTYLQIVNLNNNPIFTDLPLRLFHGNPHLREISMQGNNLHTLDAAQFPIDRIQRLYLGDNPLQCNCSILWLWRLVTNNYVDEDQPLTAAASSETVSALKNTEELDSNPNETIFSLKLDTELIGCNSVQDDTITRRKLRLLAETDISCPAHIVTIVCAILSTLVVVMTGASILFYLRFVRRRRKLLQDRRTVKTIVNVHDRIMQHHHSGLHTQNQYQQHHPQATSVDKLELERYLAAQAIANEYRALKPWELPVKDSLNDEPEHLYEKFDHYEYPDSRTMSKPHVVYV